MSRIFSLIETQVNLILGTILDQGTLDKIRDGEIQIGPQSIVPVAYFLSMLIFLFVILAFGVYLWNFGLHPVFPGIIAKIDPANPAQATNPYVQLVITLIAIMTIF